MSCASVVLGQSQRTRAIVGVCVVVCCLWTAASRLTDLSQLKMQPSSAIMRVWPRTMNAEAIQHVHSQPAHAGHNVPQLTDGTANITATEAERVPKSNPVGISVGHDLNEAGGHVGPATCANEEQ